MKKQKLISIFKNNKGLSLLEILVASTIMVFLGLGVITISDNSFKTKDRVISEDEEFLAIEMGLTRIEQDFSQIYTPLFFSKQKEIPINKEEDMEYEELSSTPRNERFPIMTELGYMAPLYSSPDKSTFEFFTSSNRRKIQDAQQSHFAWVHYALESASSYNDELSDVEKNLMYLIRYYFPLDPFSREPLDFEKTQGQVLIKNIKSLEFSFWDPKNKKFVSSLKEVMEADKVQGVHILRGMQLKFTWVDKNGIEMEENRIFRSHWPYFKEKDEDEKKKAIDTTEFPYED